MTRLTDRELDARAIAYHAGLADGRWRRPQRNTPDAPDWLNRAYNRGYHHGVAQPARPWPPTDPRGDVIVVSQETVS